MIAAGARGVGYIRRSGRRARKPGRWRRRERSFRFIVD